MKLPATKSGCGCSKGAIYKSSDGQSYPATSSFSSSCLTDQSNNPNYTCSNILALPEVELKDWRGSLLCFNRSFSPAFGQTHINIYIYFFFSFLKLNFIHLCIYSLFIYSLILFVENVFQGSDGLCPSGHHSCGAGTYDTTRAVCVSDSYQGCPINWMGNKKILPTLSYTSSSHSFCF